MVKLQGKRRTKGRAVALGLGLCAVLALLATLGFFALAAGGGLAASTGRPDLARWAVPAPQGFSASLQTIQTAQTGIEARPGGRSTEGIGFQTGDMGPATPFNVLGMVMALGLGGVAAHKRSQ